jgi:hypothetical protein
MLRLVLGPVATRVFGPGPDIEKRLPRLSADLRGRAVTHVPPSQMAPALVTTRREPRRVVDCLEGQRAIFYRQGG